MNFEKFTIKASEAVQEAHDLALKMKHNKIETLHMAKALLEQTDGYVPLILKNLKINTQQLRHEIDSELEKHPTIE